MTGEWGLPAGKTFEDLPPEQALPPAEVATDPADRDRAATALAPIGVPCDREQVEIAAKLTAT